MLNSWESATALSMMFISGVPLPPSPREPTVNQWPGSTGSSASAPSTTEDIGKGVTSRAQDCPPSIDRAHLLPPPSEEPA